MWAPSPSLASQRVAAPLAFPVVTQGSAFGFSASVTGLSFGAGGIDPVVTESAAVHIILGEFPGSGSILIELAAGALVVLNVTGVSAVGKLFFHLGQMVGADMSAFIATDVADII